MCGARQRPGCRRDRCRKFGVRPACALPWTATAIGTPPADATPGNALAATLAHDNSPPGGLQSQVSLYDAEVTLQPGKTVTSVTMPNVSASAQQGTNAIHIFSMAIGTPAPA